MKLLNIETQVTRNFIPQILLNVQDFYYHKVGYTRYDERIFGPWSVFSLCNNYKTRRWEESVAVPFSTRLSLTFQVKKKSVIFQWLPVQEDLFVFAISLLWESKGQYVASRVHALLTAVY
jgi:hypothetical protein